MEVKQTDTPDPRYPLMTKQHALQILANCGDDRELAQEAIGEALRLREESIALSLSDPLRHGFEPPVFDEARELVRIYDELLLSGANRPGKTEWCAKYGTEDLVHNEGKTWAFFHSTEATSILQQHPRIHKMLPPEWRNLGKRGNVAYVKFSMQQGFASNRFVLPNKSRGLFFNYKQDPDVHEGYELDGVWFDELVPLAFLETMRYRLGKDKRLIILESFTPKNGFTPTVKDILSGMDIIKTARAELLSATKVHVKGGPPGHMPVVMKHPKKSKAAEA